MVARAEQQRRGQSLRKTSTKHPYAAIEHRIIDSPAFSDLKPSSQVLLLLLARQHTGKNNGHLQTTFKWCSQYGFGSEHTLRGAIADLIAHGLIYRTRSHGANKAWARYALTWLPIIDKDGLFLSGFSPNAWRDWIMPNGKITPQKLLDHSGKKCSFTPEVPAESAGSWGAKTADYELCCHVGSTDSPNKGEESSPEKPISAEQTIGLAKLSDWIPDYLAQLTERGLAGFCPVETRLPYRTPADSLALH